jgi:hypothetical protein
MCLPGASGTRAVVGDTDRADVADDRQRNLATHHVALRVPSSGKDREPLLADGGR